jgi:hypothetical protein
LERFSMSDKWACSCRTWWWPMQHARRIHRILL